MLARTESAFRVPLRVLIVEPVLDFDLSDEGTLVFVPRLAEATSFAIGVDAIHGQIGLALLVIGIVLISIGGLSGKGETKMAVGGFIGFIPFGFSNDPKLARALMMNVSIK